MMGRLKKNEQGQVSWEQAAADRRSALYDMLPRQGAREDAKVMVKRYDSNEDGLVQQGELRRYVANTFGDAFNLTTNLAGRSPASALTELLDTDGDETLSAQEIAAVFERLKSRDQDDNDLLTVAEISGQMAGYYRAAALGGARDGAQQLSMLLGPAGNLSAAYDAIAKQYRDKDGKLRAACFTLLPHFVEQLDTNGNGEFERSEAAGLNTITPHLTCEAALFDKKPQTLSIKVAASELQSIVKVDSTSDNSMAVRLPATTLTFSVARAASTSTYRTLGQSYVDRFDKDKNGYLEASEVEGQQGFALLFGSWDIDGDGKVYAAEIAAALERQMALLQMKFNVVAADQGSPLFSAIDSSGDGQLGLREILAATDKLKSFDQNGDGQIARDEMPRPISLTLSMGNAGNPMVVGQNVNVFVAGGQQPATPSKTDWFSAMDRNSDGDISRREFLGASEKFDQLDANRDGLLDRKEAGAEK
jgi:Ca2+-binding EF-hand superfamily protein